MAHNPECGLDCVSAGAVRLDNPASPNQQTGRQHLSGDHTPGPWLPRYSDRVTRADDVDGTKSIAHVYGVRGEPYAQQANQHLISAAPDMLEALRRLVACCEKHPAFTKPSNRITLDRMDAARAAIAKAEGRDR
jgi:hypothetical protein